MVHLVAAKPDVSIVSASTMPVARQRRSVWRNRRASADGKTCSSPSSRRDLADRAQLRRKCCFLIFIENQLSQTT
jgi:hypothetical protein